jgi:hypothetical protein
MAPAGDARPTPRTMVETSVMAVVLSTRVLLKESAWVLRRLTVNVRPGARATTYISGEILDVSALLGSA